MHIRIYIHIHIHTHTHVYMYILKLTGRHTALEFAPITREELPTGQDLHTELTLAPVS